METPSWEGIFAGLDNDLNGLNFFDSNGMASSGWGSKFWTIKQSLAIRVDEEAKQQEIEGKTQEAYTLRLAYCRFIDALTLLLPCVWCRQRFEPWVAANPVQDSMHDLWTYVWTDHNAVNVKTKKAVLPEALKPVMYHHFRIVVEMESDVPIEWQKTLWIVLFILVLNLPNPLDVRLPRHKAIHDCFLDFMDAITVMIPRAVHSTNTTFYDKWQKCYAQMRPMLSHATLSRKNAYKWMWTLQESINPCLEKTCVQMFMWIEETFRVHDQKTTAPTFAHTPLTDHEIEEIASQHVHNTCAQ